VGEDEQPYTVVGVVGSVKQFSLTENSSTGSIYFPYSRVFVRNYFLAARTSLPPESLADTLTKILREVDPEMPLTDLRSMEVRIAESLTNQRSPALLAGVFAGTALLLAAIGLYGVLAYAVAQRTNEFGIRMALGAQRRNVLGLVFWEGMRLIAIGLVLGIGGALFLTEGMRSLLFNISPSDPLTFV
jgi:ABC-type antimicrobial peptide transport system permease subunit